MRSRCLAEPVCSNKRGADVMSWWKHAFAVESAELAEPTPDQRDVVDGFCRRIVERGLAAPAILFLESSLPLGPMAAQGLLVMQPWLELVADRSQVMVLTKFLDRRGSLAWLVQRIEQLAGSATSARNTPEAAP